MRSSGPAMILSTEELTRLNRLQKAIHDGLLAALQHALQMPVESYRMGAVRARLGFAADGAPVLLQVVADRPLEALVLPVLVDAPEMEDAEPLPGPLQMPFCLEEMRGEARLVVVTDRPQDAAVQRFLGQYEAAVQTDFDGLGADVLAVMDVASAGTPPCRYLNDVRNLHLGRPQVLEAFAARRLDSWLGSKDAALLEAACRSVATGGLFVDLLSFDDALLGPAMFETASGERLVPMLSA